MNDNPHQDDHIYIYIHTHTQPKPSNIIDIFSTPNHIIMHIQCHLGDQYLFIFPQKQSTRIFKPIKNNFKMPNITMHMCLYQYLYRDLKGFQSSIILDTPKKIFNVEIHCKCLCQHSNTQTPCLEKIPKLHHQKHHPTFHNPLYQKLNYFYHMCQILDLCKHNHKKSSTKWRLHLITQLDIHF